jgi:hypothetical protein
LLIRRQRTKCQNRAQPRGKSAGKQISRNDIQIKPQTDAKINRKIYRLTT